MTDTTTDTDKAASVIVCAAVRHEDLIICGPRHFDQTMWKQLSALGYENGHDFDQGFIDQHGTFFGREDAMITAKRAGQRINFERNCSSMVLFSEGLY